MLEKIPPELYSHMPFLTKDVMNNDILFLCLAQPELNIFGNRTWKIYYIDGIHDSPVRIDTKLTADTFECSPTGWYDSDGWHISFIAGGDPKNPKFCLYRMDGSTLDMMGDPVVVKEYASSGFVNKDGTVYSMKTPDFDYIVSGLDDVKFDLSEILRVSYRADDLNKLLISYKKSNDIVTTIYDKQSKSLYRVICDGQPAYKFTMYGDTIIYAQIIDSGFENRKLKVAESIELIPLLSFP
jgi:hypothetical protein